MKEAVSQNIQSDNLSHQNAIKNKEEQKARIKKFRDQLEIGTILYTSWGYEQTNVDFYQVIEKSRAYCVIRELKQAYDATGSMQGYVVPLPNEFTSKEPMKKRGLDALVVIGGDGSYMGAKRLTEMGFPCIGLPGTIDNDIKGTDYTIGYFTALGTVVEAIDRLRDTSSSHQRISIVEVMGRYCGDLTLAAAIAGGCEFVVVPEVEFSREDLVAEIKAGIAKGKKHAIVAITEHICDVDELAKYIETETKRETRATVLGHIQRGGSPGPYDRILASRMGAYAIELLLQGHGGRCVGIQNEKLVHHDIIDAIENMKRPFKGDWLDCAKKLY